MTIWDKYFQRRSALDRDRCGDCNLYRDRDLRACGTRERGRAVRLAVWRGVIASAGALTVACGSPEEAPTVELNVYADSSALETVTTDRGYRVELSRARLVISNLQFAIAGEAHAASLLRKVSDFILPNANAHPGHYQGGEITGELRGRYIVDWFSDEDEALGVARLIVGKYRSANFTFESARTDDEGLGSHDDLLGHTALLEGTATKDEVHVEFLALIDSPTGRQLAGAPFERTVTETSPQRLGLALVTKDPLEGDTLFDGIDFSELDVDEDGRVALVGDSDVPDVVAAYNQLRRTFQTHDHFTITAGRSR